MKGALRIRTAVGRRRRRQPNGVKHRQGSVTLEHPKDPAKEPFASIWIAEETEEMEEETGARRVDLDQCEYGAPSQKPSTMSGNLEGMEKLAAVCSHPTHPLTRLGKVAGVFPTGEMARYPQPLCLALAQGHVQ